MEIRPMTEEDFASYYACLDAVAREGRYLSMAQAPPVARSRGWVLTHLRDHQPMVVADAETRVVGWCDITPRDREVFQHRGVMGMGVHPDFRRRGLGARLLDEALRQARISGLEQVELEVFASNEAAIRLYERTGFQLAGTLPRGRKLNGRYEDIHIMVRPLEVAE